jgi:hypothetical protein
MQAVLSSRLITAIDDARQLRKFCNRQLFSPSLWRYSRFSQQSSGILLVARLERSIFCVVEGRCRNAGERRDPAWPGIEWVNSTTADATFGAGVNAGRQRHHGFGARSPLRQDGGRPYASSAGWPDAICNFALKHQHHAVEPWWPRHRLEPPNKQLRGNAVGQVGRNRHRPRASYKRWPIGLKRTPNAPSNDPDTRRDLLESRQAPQNALNDDVLGAFHQQRPRQPPGPAQSRRSCDHRD